VTDQLANQTRQPPLDLNVYFGETAPKGPRAKPCAICGKPSEVRINLAIKEILRREEGKRKGGGDGRSRTVTRSFCLEHGASLFDDVKAQLNAFID
jgi:hypothetical protein